MENQVKFLSMGCRLNALEAEKIKAMLINAGTQDAIIVNTCAVTGEAERQSRQAIRKLSRENPGIPLYITGCAATRAPKDYEKIPGVVAVVANKDKFNINAYIPDYKHAVSYQKSVISSLSKAFVQIQNGCNHNCAYCIVSKLRGKNVSFQYEKILEDVRAATTAGFYEIVLTGVDIAGFRMDKETLPDLCAALLRDVPKLARLRLSSLDPGVNLRPIIDLMHKNPRMLPHMHLSMQSGSDKILAAMGRRHNAQMVRELTEYADKITFSWDIICGFPGETQELFEETCALVRELKPIHIHVFPFSPRPGTLAATMPNQVDRAESKRRVRIINQLAKENRRRFMQSQIGQTSQVLMEENNTGRTPDDIPVKLGGAAISPKKILDVKLTGLDEESEYMKSSVVMIE
ncbi:MAG: MiaB/RimO family radical SAM methylthiotransferase [Alphaproteobacteria bacterium]|nr:MiaB/RimO family radical SAM methylthiotransferase [Alphaproteobacteria bacterium]